MGAKKREQSYEERDREIISKAAMLLVAKHDPSIAPTLETEMLEVASHSPTSGGVGSRLWVASLRSLGEVIIALAKREEAKNKARGI